VSQTATMLTSGSSLPTPLCALCRARRKLSQGLCELVEDMGLVSFVPLAIQVGGGQGLCHVGSTAGDQCKPLITQTA